MKKLTLLVLFIGFGNIMSAQRFSAIADIGYRPGFESSPKVGLGAQFKYKMLPNTYIAADFMAYIPKREYSGKGLDINITGQHLINIISNKVALYPIVGLVISNHLFRGRGGDPKMTDLGGSFGIGGEFYITKQSFINADFKYYLLKKDKPHWYDNYSLIRLGYGFRF